MSHIQTNSKLRLLLFTQLSFLFCYFFFFFSSRRRHTRYIGDWSSDVCSSDLNALRIFNARFETQRVDNREDKRWGASSPAQWARLKTLYREQNLIQRTGDINEVFTNQLIDEINRFDQQAVIRQAREYR